MDRQTDATKCIISLASRSIIKLIEILEPFHYTDKSSVLLKTLHLLCFLKSFYVVLLELLLQLTSGCRLSDPVGRNCRDCGDSRDSRDRGLLTL